MSTKAGSRANVVWTLILTSAATFMAALDNLVVTTALPALWLGALSLVAAAVAMIWVPRGLPSVDISSIRASEEVAAPA